eukprot:GDKJ01015910.1.p1 GENE.GDKJ01015910.1~~GDKJ01015910.1.p1  ORF type:complete len:387 (-),score=75.71 GDKJ01015910.1:74-1234(-)
MQRPKHIPEYVWSKIGKNLYQNPNHPLAIVKENILDFFRHKGGVRSVSNAPHMKPGNYVFRENYSPIVEATKNFDELRIPVDHVSRSPSDTYYMNLQTKSHLLRTQSTCHQTDLLREGVEACLWTSDVYRRDEIDAVHYPVFHQIDGIRIWSRDELGGVSDEQGTKMATEALQDTIEGLIDHLYGPRVERRWDYGAYFPFTEPSLEMEVKNEAGKWVEVLGCGAIHREIMKNTGRENHFGWAFGLGLERLAMQKFSIPDIRLFWSDDSRFAKQFEAGKFTTFKPFSKMPPVCKDIAFFVPPGSDGKGMDFDINAFFETCRSLGGEDCVEEVTLIDDFFHPKKQKRSLCFRITYRSLEKTLTHEEVNAMQHNIIDAVRKDMGLELRG